MKIDHNRLFRMSPNKIYRKYLWKYNKIEWLGLVAKTFMNQIKPLVFLFLTSLPLTFSINTLADGTMEKQWLIENIKNIQATLPLMEKAFNDVDKLSNSISRIAYKDLNESFIYSFLIVKWARHYGIDPNEVASIIQTESKFNQYAISKIGAKGLAQINTYHWPMEDPFDGEKNIAEGAKILYLYKRSYPNSYLNAYSGGAYNYTQKVRINMKKIMKNS